MLCLLDIVLVDVMHAVPFDQDKLKPKVKSAENAAAASQRQAEKAAIAAQNAGGRAGGKGGAGGRGGKGGSVVQQRFGGGSMAGGKSQWLSILRILRQGGREATGGNDAIDFGVGLAGGLKSARVKEEIAQQVRCGDVTYCGGGTHLLILVRSHRGSNVVHVLSHSIRG